MPRSSWQIHRDGRTHYVDINDRDVVCGSHAGSELSDEAGGCTHEEFLGGQLQGDIRAVYGEETLKEIVAAVRARAASTG